jgi:cobalt-zinc-cadmium efflux system outer membrane protein
MVNVIDNGIGGRTDGSLTLGLPLPLWNRNQGGVFQAQFQVVEAERALERLELNLQNRLAPIFERYSNALNQVSRYRDGILPAAKQSLDLTRRLYDGGEAGYTQLLIVQRTFAQTNLAYLEAIRQLREAAITMDGLLLNDSLRTE